MSLTLWITAPAWAASPKPGGAPVTRPVKASPKPFATETPTPGSVVGLLTWQYNKFVGTKPDVGASACLIPKDSPKVTADDARGVMLDADLGLSSTSKKYGWVCGKADGSGTVNFDTINPGSYSALVISEKTTRNFKLPLRDTELATLGIYFTEGAVAIISARPSTLMVQQWAVIVSDVLVRSGAVSHFGYDFGNTYI